MPPLTLKRRIRRHQHSCEFENMCINTNATLNVKKTYKTAFKINKNYKYSVDDGT